MQTLIKRKQCAVLPFNAEKIKDKFLISNLLGAWALLTENEFIRLSRYDLDHDRDAALLNDLCKKGIIINAVNLPHLIADYRKLNSHLFGGVFLHIAVVTTRCNLSCRYCQTKNNHPFDMDKKIAKRIIDFMSEANASNLSLEMQGGEPLLNFEIVKYFAKNSRSIDRMNRVVSLSLVTNGVLLDKEKTQFLADNNIGLCISLDGPQDVHDTNRVFSNGNGSYTKVSQAIKMAQNIYSKSTTRRKVMLLPTITKYSLKYPKEIVDEYVKWGASTIALRPLTKVGAAVESWKKIGYTPEEFNAFWHKAMDHILDLNKKGVLIKERMTAVFLKKILKKQDPGYVDLMSPCGAGRKVLTYMPNGDVYPCDEARMTGEEMFHLGNLTKNISYDNVIRRSGLCSLSTASLINLWQYNSVFLSWLGTCPVLNYMQQGNIIPKITTTPLHKIYSFQLRYLFEKIVTDEKNREIFLRWIEKGGRR